MALTGVSDQLGQLRGNCGQILRAIYPPPFFGALLRVMGASGGALALFQVKKGAFITARELSHKKLKEVLQQ